ncbi:MAG: hypothetical protein JRN68_10495 [Nitrososphaerota archaeon]|nr:hypothetical protein [Nitrososphaerota archaeon]
MAQTIKVLAGAYWDYWLAEDGIYRIQIVSTTLTFAMTVAVFLFVFFFLDPSIIGALTGTILGYLLGNWLSGRRASKKRAVIHTYEPNRLSESGARFSKLRWDEISSAELKGRSLHLVVDNRKTKVPVPTSISEPVRRLAVSKLGSKFIQS